MAAEAGISSNQAAWNRVNDGPDWLWVQAIMYLESSARFIIIKNALDDFLARGSAPPPHATLKVGSLSLEMPLEHSGIERQSHLE